MNSLLKEAYDALLGEPYNPSPNKYSIIKRIREELEKRELKTMPFDPTKPVQIRNGQPAVILEVMEDGFFPIIGRYLSANHLGWVACAWDMKGREGSHLGESDKDLINIPEAPETVTLWVEILSSKTAWHSYLGNTNENPPPLSDDDKLFARVKITAKKGEGL